MGISDQINADLKAAMLARDEQRLGALRMIRAEILKAEKQTGTAPDEARVQGLLQTMIKQRRDSVEQFEQGGRPELAAKERAEAEVIQSYLPAALSEEDVARIVDEVLTSLGTPDPKQLGKVIGQVMGKLKASGKPFDAAAANALVKARLGLLA